MKLQNVINKAISDMYEKGCTSALIIKHIKDNFDKISENYDFLHVCMDCHYAFNEMSNPDSDNFEHAEQAVSAIKSQFPYHYHFFDGSEFSGYSCDCCKATLGGDRFFYIVFN